MPAALEALCLRALAKQPADRPASAANLANEVQSWQENERRKAEVALQESEALYHSLVESLPGMPVMLLTTYRPGYRPAWMDKSYTTQLSLARLSDQMETLLNLGIIPSPIAVTSVATKEFLPPPPALVRP